jgi:hypothetical protein
LYSTKLHVGRQLQLQRELLLDNQDQVLSFDRTFEVPWHMREVCSAFRDVLDDGRVWTPIFARDLQAIDRGKGRHRASRVCLGADAIDYWAIFWHT